MDDMTVPNNQPVDFTPENTTITNTVQPDLPPGPPQLTVVEGGKETVVQPRPAEASQESPAIQYTYRLNKMLLIPVLDKFRLGRKIGEVEMKPGHVIVAYRDPEAPEGLEWGASIEKFVREYEQAQQEAQP